MTRYVIVCPAHAAPASVRGDERVCPVGDHRLTRWWLVDARRQVVVEQVCAETGSVESEINLPLASCPRLTVEGVSLTAKERSMPRGVPGSGPYGDPSKAAQQPKPKVARGKACLMSTKLSAGSKVLWLRLVRSASGDDDTRFRIRWEQVDAKDPKAASESGVVAAFGDAQEGEARRAYKETVEGATIRGWVPAPTGHLVLKPIPAPPGGAKGRKAA